jgi:hypothetical protein
MACNILEDELHERVIEHVTPLQRGRRDSQGEKIQESRTLTSLPLQNLRAPAFVWDHCNKWFLRTH